MSPFSFYFALSVGPVSYVEKNPHLCIHSVSCVILCGSMDGYLFLSFSSSFLFLISFSALRGRQAA